MKNLALLLLLFATSAHAAESKVGYVGIGLKVGQMHGIVTVSEIRPDGPAARAGVKEEEILHAVDHVSVAGKMNKEIGAEIRGSGIEGTVVVLTLEEPKSHAVRDVSITREYLELACLAQGRVQLHLNETIEKGYLTGGIGGEHAIYWPIENGVTGGFLNVMNVELRIAKGPRKNFVISGMIGETEINWVSKGLDWDLEQPCIH